MRHSRPSFSRILPFVAFVLCVVLLEAFTALNYLNLRRISAHGRAVVIHSHGVDVRIPPNRFFIASVVAAGSAASRPIQAANMPAMATEALVSALTRTWPDSWRPSYFGPLPDGLFAWRGLIFPAYCLPFWWFAGLGIDAILARRSFRWPILLAGTLFFAILAFLGIGLAVTASSGDMAFVLTGFAFWTLLFATFPIAWFRLIRQRRKLNRAQPGFPSA